MGEIRQLLLDMDGVLICAGREVPGAIETLRQLDRVGFPYLVLTNNTRLSKRQVVDNLRGHGFTIEDRQIMTAPEVAGEMIAARGLRPHYLVSEEPKGDLPPGASPDEADCVVVGDLMEDFNYDVLDEAFRVVKRSGRLIAIQKNRYWKRDGKFRLDCGPFVAALEYASGVEAEVIGKPTRAFFEAAMGHFGDGVLTDGTAMVGDDVVSDVRGARDVGMTGVLVRTGKYHAGDEEAVPEAVVLDSIAAVPDWLEIAAPA